jgi:hypothetical protein
MIVDRLIDRIRSELQVLAREHIPLPRLDS